MHRKLIILIVAVLIGPALPRTLVVLAEESGCVPGPVLGPNDVPFVFDYDANDVLLPLWPGDPTRWDLPAGLVFRRPPALACDPDGQAFESCVCVWWTCETKPTVTYDPNSATWTTSIVPDMGVDRAVYRVNTVPGPEGPDPNDTADYTLTWRGIKPPNRRPLLH